MLPFVEHKRLNYKITLKWASDLYFYIFFSAQRSPQADVELVEHAGEQGKQILNFVRQQNLSLINHGH